MKCCEAKDVSTSCEISLCQNSCEIVNLMSDKVVTESVMSFSSAVFKLGIVNIQEGAIFTSGAARVNVLFKMTQV